MKRTALSFKLLRVFGAWGTVIGITGTIGALVLSRTSLRPAIVKTFEYGYAIKEKIFGQFDTIIEDVEDMVAEAKYKYEDERKKSISIESSEDENYIFHDDRDNPPTR